MCEPIRYWSVRVKLKRELLKAVCTRFCSAVKDFALSSFELTLSKVLLRNSILVIHHIAAYRCKLYTLNKIRSELLHLCGFQQQVVCLTCGFSHGIRATFSTSRRMKRLWKSDTYVCGVNTIKSDWFCLVRAQKHVENLQSVRCIAKCSWHCKKVNGACIRCGLCSGLLGKWDKDIFARKYENNNNNSNMSILNWYYSVCMCVLYITYTNFVCGLFNGVQICDLRWYIWWIWRCYFTVSYFSSKVIIEYEMYIRRCILQDRKIARHKSLFVLVITYFYKYVVACCFF